MQLPENKKVRLIQGISRVFHTPYIIEGETSSTGKTIEVTPKHHESKTYRLDTEKILTGGVEVRRATTFQLYTRDKLIRQKKANTIRPVIITQIQKRLWKKCSMATFRIRLTRL